MRRRSGFALVAAIVAIVLIGVLVTSGLFASNQESHSTGAELAEQQTAAFAERAAIIAVTGWSCPECDQLAVGSVFIRNPVASPPLESTVYITRLDSALFIVTGEARLTRSGAVALRRRASIAVKIARDSLGTARASRIDGDSWAVAYQM
jgi:type II secretory pathway pseudopilin PulG